jgi:F-type H+-transporting ATPase subunit b
MAGIIETFGIQLNFVLTMAIAFVILFVILKSFAFGPIFAMLQARQDKIRQDLDDAEARRAEMVRLQKEYEQRLAQIEDEARNKIQAAVKEAQAARDELLQKAHSEAQTIVERSRQEIVREREIANAEMRNQIAHLSAQVAGRLIKQTLDPNAHSRLVDEVIGTISVNGGSDNAVRGGEGMSGGLGTAGSNQ